MIKQQYTSHGDHLSVFTPRESKQKSAQKKVYDEAKSQFLTTKQSRGTSGTSVFICMDARRKYKYYDE